MAGNALPIGPTRVGLGANERKLQSHAGLSRALHGGSARIAEPKQLCCLVESFSDGVIDGGAIEFVLARTLDAQKLTVTTGDQQQQQPTRTQIEAAVATLIDGGNTVAAYMLDTDSEDYTQFTAQLSAPCVLAMVKGRGMAAVGDEITSEKLLQAFVSASRSPDATTLFTKPNCNA